MNRNASALPSALQQTAYSSPGRRPKCGGRVTAVLREGSLLLYCAIPVQWSELERGCSPGWFSSTTPAGLAHQGRQSPCGLDIPDALGCGPDGLFGDLSTPRGCVPAGSVPAIEG